ncbi:AAA family ATPase [Megasphaera sp.]|jgi:hypothetical protein|uniref:AAA family ATPase n=1 Tax=Megasphaera sp. TaxID=2023260 RepID=UPI0025BBD23D|nr:AAA family ATPase [Megasphaera sp.]
MQGLPIGIDDFAKVREGNYYFVDKTLAIRDFLDNHGEVLLLMRPRRFGKTLFLSMFYYFLPLIRNRITGNSFAAWRLNGLANGIWRSRGSGQSFSCL